MVLSDPFLCCLRRREQVFTLEACLASPELLFILVKPSTMMSANSKSPTVGRRFLERRRHQPLRLPQTTQPAQASKPLPQSPPLNRRMDLLLQLRPSGLDRLRTPEIRIFSRPIDQRFGIRWVGYRLGISQVKRGG